jgi:hypothetical protein
MFFRALPLWTKLVCGQKNARVINNVAPLCEPQFCDVHDFQKGCGVDMAVSTGLRSIQLTLHFIL